MCESVRAGSITKTKQNATKAHFVIWGNKLGSRTAYKIEGVALMWSPEMEWESKPVPTVHSSGRKVYKQLVSSSMFLVLPAFSNSGSLPSRSQTKGTQLMEASSTKCERTASFLGSIPFWGTAVESLYIQMAPHAREEDTPSGKTTGPTRALTLTFSWSTWDTVITCVKLDLIIVWCFNWL